jgi:hypothetical protein
MAKNPFDEIYHLIPDKKIEYILWIISIILLVYAFLIEDVPTNVSGLALFIAGLSGGISYTSKKINKLKKSYEHPDEYIDDRGIARLERPGFADLEKALPKFTEIAMFFGISVLAYAYGGRRRIESYSMFAIFLGLAISQLFLWIRIMYKRK